MLLIIRNMRSLSFSSLMDIYAEGNAENGRDKYPNLSQNQQILLAEQDFYQYLNQVFFLTDGAFYAVWAPQGRYVAALRMEPYHDGLLLEALETRPEARHKGYASQLILEAINWLSQQGRGKIYSHVSKKNAASISTHLKCGFQKILDHAVYADGSVLHSSITFYLEY